MRTDATRAELARSVRELKAAGVSGPKIADRLGISNSYTYMLLHDPTLDQERQRKRKYDGACVDCGGRTVGDGKLSGPPKRCRECAVKHVHATAKWTEITIAEAIRGWAQSWGAPPSATDWNAGLQSIEAARRWHAGSYPPTSTVQRVFGSWNSAIAAAGFTPQRAKNRGRGPGSLTKADYDRTIDLYRRGVPLAEIANEFGISRNGVWMRLKRCGVVSHNTTGRTKVPASLKAEQVIDREIERMENRAERLRQELAEAETAAERLKMARSALAGADNLTAMSA